MLESEAIPVHFEDVDMVGEAIEERSGKPFRAKDLGPLVEGQVGCHQDRSSFVSLAEYLKEQLGPGLGQWHEAQFVDACPELAEGISSLRLARRLCRLSRRRSSLASISSCTSAAAVVKPTDSPRWHAARPRPRAI